ncbi:tumor necrosis factor-like [Acanthopagrus schlegelii]
MAVSKTTAEVVALDEKSVFVPDENLSSGLRLQLAAALVLVVLLGTGCTGLLVWYYSEGPDVTTQPGPTEAPANTDTAETTYSSYTMASVSTREKAAIHLEAEGFSKDDQLKWQDSSGSAFARGGLRLVDNDIVIPESGLYFVYSQAVFRVTCSYDTYVSHKIFRYSDSFDAPLLIMFAIKSVCQDTNRQNGEAKFFEHVYLGGVFQLKEGDRLGTTSYWTLDVQTDSGKTFFGAFAV